MASPVTKPSPAGKRSGGGLANIMANKSKTNMQRINDAAAGNMELQTLLCETIDTYESQKEAGQFHVQKKKSLASRALPTPTASPTS